LVHQQRPLAAVARELVQVQELQEPLHLYLLIPQLVVVVVVVTVLMVSVVDLVAAVVGMEPHYRQVARQSQDRDL
jgi:hypothetical protein